MQGPVLSPMPVLSVTLSKFPGAWYGWYGQGKKNLGRKQALQPNSGRVLAIRFLWSGTVIAKGRLQELRSLRQYAGVQL